MFEKTLLIGLILLMAMGCESKDSVPDGGDEDQDGDTPSMSGDADLDGEPLDDDALSDGDTSDGDTSDDDTSDGDGDAEFPDGDASDTDSDEETDPVFGNRVLIFYGRSGVDESGIYGYGAHLTVAERYATAGLTVDYTSQWPESLVDYRLVILAVPGFDDSDDRFVESEVNALLYFLGNGGVLFIENEKSFYSGTTVINDLLTRLGSSIRQQDDIIGTGGYYGVLTTDITNHPFMEGVETLGFGESSLVQPGAAPCLVEYSGQCVMAVEAMGSGFLIAAGDQQFIDDHALESFPPDGGDNVRFAENLARLPR